MCLGGGGSPKVETPKPPPLPPPLPPPPPPKPPAPPPKQLVAPEAAPDIRIGGAKKQTTGGSRRGGDTGKAVRSLSISDNQGLEL